ncbi:hypothetical protein ACTJJ0_02955 [Chitinophaga sp. 22321]|uniref:Uncharacterized protein n=1 Tax=Chitinophaga hostae TaxID=2831022 RepID=A0ABS5JCW4_9BACT|nr:hypothetical protein [Chitinophaga hostae]MBS0032462.1 hypothetical protein [Chitinophaga hostae]
MKQLKRIMIAAVLVLGTAGAIFSAHASRAARVGPSLLKTFGPKEIYTGFLVTAADQDLSHYSYIPPPNEGECTASDYVCTYELFGTEIRTYNQGNRFGQ